MIRRWLESVSIALGGRRATEAPDGHAAGSVDDELVVVVDLVRVSEWDRGAIADLVVVPQAWHRRAELVASIAEVLLDGPGTGRRALVVELEPGDEDAHRAAVQARRRWASANRRVRIARGRARD